MLSDVLSDTCPDSNIGARRSMEQAGKRQRAANRAVVSATMGEFEAALDETLGMLRRTDHGSEWEDAF